MGEEGPDSLPSALAQTLRLDSYGDAIQRAYETEKEHESQIGRPLKPLPSTHHATFGNNSARTVSSHSSDSGGGAASLADEGEGGREAEWETKTTAPTSPAPSSPPSVSMPRCQPLHQGMPRPLSETSETSREKELFRFARGHGDYLSARRTSPAAVSQRDLRMLLPYWPRQGVSQEVALLNASGEAGTSHLSDMEAQARLFAQERSSTRSPRPSFSSAAKSHQHSSRHGDRSGKSAVDEVDEIVEFHSAVSPPANHKKWKSSRSALEDPHYFGGSGMPDVTASSGHAPDSLYDDGHPTRLAAEPGAWPADGSADKHDDDGIERPDVSSASFRASRLVDEIYPTSASQDDDHEQDWPTHEGRCDHHRRGSSWSHRGRRRLRSEVKLRLSIRRAQNEFWSDLALLEAEQEEEERLTKEKLAIEAASAKAAATEADKKRRERTSRAEKRVQALKGGKNSGAGGAGKKLTLADLRARTAAAFQGGGTANDSSSTAPVPPPVQVPSGSPPGLGLSQQDTSPPRSMSTAAKSVCYERSLQTCEAPSGPFLFRCDSSTTRELAAARLKLQAVLSKPFDDVAEDLDLPCLTQETRATWDKGVADRQCVMIKAKAPMVWPEEDRPRAKFTAGTVSSAILQRMGQKVPENCNRAKDFIFSPWDDLSSPTARGDKARDASPHGDIRAGSIDPEREGKRIVSKAKAGPPAMTSDTTFAGTRQRSAQRGDMSGCSQSKATQPCPPTSPSLPSEVFLPFHDQHSASSAPSPSTTTSPQPPKTSPRMSRRKKANMNNIHHQLNSARWTTSPPTATASAQQSGAYMDSHQEGTSTQGRSLTSSALFPDEYICLFCEYALFYGTKPLLLKACRHRKKTVKCKAQAEDKKKRREGKVAGTVSGHNTGNHHHDHTCTQSRVSSGQNGEDLWICYVSSPSRACGIVCKLR
ncbi:hypothetical protein BCV69DRAFT_313621 [Microstroma glucosiphilum]|uniref:Uncharacterized protein n=1 Tax=Pseudomicrostroma glucosiphilum TaxID=1684307 RepID=A0A316U1W3_9BASI|nr:hypothetical protein BCV69DRAFT_313621 [Pseudomicrostroma glucosiphilum]PWN19352.1 hypothetical protein BCV69DRAFT_313621 [Pseudomicrostroma glucosiphilum]